MKHIQLKLCVRACVLVCLFKDYLSYAPYKSVGRVGKGRTVFILLILLHLQDEDIGSLDIHCWMVWVSYILHAVLFKFIRKHSYKSVRTTLHKRYL